MIQNKIVIWWLLWTLVVCGIVFAAKDYLTPILTGILLAYILEPVGTLGKRFHIPRWLSALLILTLFCLILSAIFAIITPRLSKEIGQFIIALPRSIDQLARWLAENASHLITFISARLPLGSSTWLIELQQELNHVANAPEDIMLSVWLKVLQSSLGTSIDNVESVSDVARAFSSFFQSYGSFFAFLAELIRSSFVDIINATIAIIFSLIVYFFVFVGWHDLSSHLDDHLPQKARDPFWTLISACGEVLTGYFRGMATMVIVMASYYSITYIVIGVPYALILGLLTGCLILLPFVGFFISITCLLAVTLFPFSGWVIIVPGVIVLLLGQIIENFILTPRLVGQRIGLHPLITIFAIVIFGQAWGLVGVLVAIPLSGIVYRIVATLNTWLST